MPDLELFEQLDLAIDALLAGHSQPASADPVLPGLLEIAAVLRDLPDERFRARLASGLRPPATIQSITPFIVVPEGVQFIEFTKKVFGAGELSRHPHRGGFVANLSIGGSEFLVMGGESVRGSEAPAALHVYVPDCDDTYRRALQAGAVPAGALEEVAPADRPYGERAAFIRDAFGNLWNIATRLSARFLPEHCRHLTPGLLSYQTHGAIDFLKSAFGAEVLDLFEEGGRVHHAFLRIGDAALELAEAMEEGWRPFGFYLYTDNVDAVYDRAMQAGAKSVMPPTDQPFGDRMAIVDDPLGNRWMPTRRPPRR